MENTYKSDYVVFIDESFNEWFSLKKEDADLKSFTKISLITTLFANFACFFEVV